MVERVGHQQSQQDHRRDTQHSDPAPGEQDVQPRELHGQEEPQERDGDDPYELNPAPQQLELQVRGHELQGVGEDPE
jgi:hypothetical protein